MKFSMDSLYSAKLAEELIFIKSQKFNSNYGKYASMQQRLAGAARSSLIACIKTAGGSRG
jgi:hypothetical protein